jgi:hypothetical protein
MGTEVEEVQMTRGLMLTNTTVTTKQETTNPIMIIK